MAYYETKGGAKVFAAGTMGFERPQHRCTSGSSTTSGRSWCVRSIGYQGANAPSWWRRPASPSTPSERETRTRLSVYISDGRPVRSVLSSPLGARLTYFSDDRRVVIAGRIAEEVRGIPNRRRIWARSPPLLGEVAPHQGTSDQGV